MKQQFFSKLVNILTIAAPIIFVLGLVGFIAFESYKDSKDTNLTKPSYDFVYTFSEEYDFRYSLKASSEAGSSDMVLDEQYQSQDNYVKTKYPEPIEAEPAVLKEDKKSVFKYYTAATDTVKDISLEEVRKLKFAKPIKGNNSDRYGSMEATTAPDGWQFNFYYYGGGQGYIFPPLGSDGSGGSSVYVSKRGKIFQTSVPQKENIEPTTPTDDDGIILTEAIKSSIIGNVGNRYLIGYVKK